MHAVQAPVVIADKLPPGLTPVWIEGVAGSSEYSRGPVKCELGSRTCTFDEACAQITEFCGDGTLPPYFPIEIAIGVNVAVPPTEDNRATVSGGGAPAVSVHRPVPVGGPAAFGVQDYELSNEEEGGALDTRAGSHPFLSLIHI